MYAFKGTPLNTSILHVHVLHYMCKSITGIRTAAKYTTLCHFYGYKLHSTTLCAFLGPVVQSIVSLTSSLRGQLLSILRLYY